ncbi:hypothetical protein [Pseudomonas phage 98PfluR60PP]|uniref:Uncharacterized protein n=1 Tax=Pseudomonas phage 98PfluR60PP TaxID=2163965 RepID=A0A2S1PG13_9CAUD|nr:hypothetical protein PP760_gp89 [Pseudomonas phage 98PfluR60PP]AWH15521.1 hypothetical protein [Pseudomonas phage 98PfluR60PP]
MNITIKLFGNKAPYLVCADLQIKIGVTNKVVRHFRGFGNNTLDAVADAYKHYRFMQNYCEVRHANNVARTYKSALPLHRKIKIWVNHYLN